MLTNSCFICYSTNNYKLLADICIKTIKEMGVNDNDIYHKLDDIDISNYKIEFQSPFWYYCVKNKIKHFIDILERIKNKYQYFIISDCDIRYYRHNKNKCKNLEKYINDNNNNIFFMKEYKSKDINSGFFIIKNNDIDISIAFLKKTYELLSTNNINKKYPYGDQSVINKIKNEIKYDFIPNKYVVWGTYIYNKKYALLHHSVCAKNVEEKIIQMKQIKRQLKN